MAHTVSQTVVREMLRSVATAGAFVGLLLLVCFRDLRLALLGVVASAFPLLLTGALMSLTGTTLSLSASVVFAIVFGIAVDDTVHVITGLQANRRRGVPSPVTATIQQTGWALVLSSLALVVGFSLLAFSNFHGNRTFGILVAVTAVFALAGDLILLPALVWLAGSPRESELT
jgi:hypothetical protein